MVGNKHVIRKKVVYYTIFLLPSEISNESPDGVSPGLWVHPGVLAKVLHYMEVRASLLAQPCACVRGRERKGGGGIDVNTTLRVQITLIYVYKPI